MDENRYTSTGLTARTKTVKLLFKRSELLYDIKNYAYVEGDVMQVNTEHDRHQVQDIGETGNIDRVTKVLDLAYAESVEALFPYTKQDVEQVTEMDNMPTVVYDEEPADEGDDEVFTNEKPGMVLPYSFSFVSSINHDNKQKESSHYGCSLFVFVRMGSVSFLLFWF